MAYREFHFEKIYEAPDMHILSDGLNAAANNIGNMFRGIGENMRKKRLAADQYKFDLGQGKFENDDKIFFQRGLNLTERGRADMKQYGQISPQVQKDQEMALVDKNSSDWQFKTMSDMSAMISKKATEDKYYDPDVDIADLKKSAYGEDNDVYYNTRGERLQEYSKIMFKNPKSLRGKVYTSDYVKTFGKKENSKASENPNMKSSDYMATPFLTPAGIPGVTIDHAKQYLGSRADGSVARWVENLVDEDMLPEVSYMRQHSDKFKSMTDAEAQLYLKAHPEENLVNKEEFSSRVIKRAQNELLEAADINRKVDYETKVDKSITQGLYNNDAIGHSYSDHQDAAIESRQGVGYEGEFGGYLQENQMANNMPGGILRIGKGAKVGQAIPLELNPTYMYNVRNGKVQENKGSTSFNLTGYQLTAYDKDGKPRMLSQDQISSMKPSDFKNLSPELGVALRGYTVNQGNKLGEIASRQSALDDDYAEAVRKNDIDGQENIQDQIKKLEELKQKLNLSPTEVSDEDLLSAFKQNGIGVSSIKQDLIIKPSNADLQLINNTLTRGLDLTNDQKYSPEMRARQAEYRKRYQEAAAKGFKDESAPVPKTEKVKKTSAIPTITSQEDYDKLAPGSQYIDPDGVVKTKKKK